MPKKFRIPYNPYFLIPFVLWIIAGGILIMAFDKKILFFAVNTRYSAFGDILMYYITMLGQAEVIIPVLLALMILPRFRNWWYFTTALLCNVFPFIIHHFIKGYLNHPRPRLLYENLPELHYLPEWPRLLHSGFPSGHSQGAFSFFCFLSLILVGKNRKLGVLFFMLALAAGYSRIYLTAHFFEDVYAGSIFGTVVTTLVFSVMEYYKGKFPKHTHN